MTDYPAFNPGWSEEVQVAWLNNYRHDPSEAPNIERTQPTAPMSFANYPIKDKPTAPADDEATIKAMYEAMPSSGFLIDGIQSQVAKIRRGEVHGLTTTAEAQEALTAAHAWADAEIKRLHVERDTAIARASAAEACVGTLRDILGCEVRNVSDCSMEQHSREIYNAARTAHAEARALILEVLSGRGMTWETRAREHIAKHQNKDASK